MTNKLTAEELEEWRSHPVTEKLLAILRKGTAANRRGLEAQLWASGSCSPEALGRVKASEELIEDLTDATNDEWEQWNEHFEHQRDKPPGV